MREIHVKSRTRFLLVAAMAVGLSFLAASVYACIDYVNTGADAWTFWLHCDTSAGNFANTCDPDGNCYDLTGDDPILQGQVNIYCQSPFSCAHRDDPIPPELTKLHIGQPKNTLSAQVASFRRMAIRGQIASLCKK